MNGKSWDHILIRLKDILILASAVIAIVLWVGDFWGLPSRVEAHEKTVLEYKVHKAQQDVFTAEIKKDIEHLKNESSKQSHNIEKILNKLNERQ